MFKTIATDCAVARKALIRDDFYVTAIDREDLTVEFTFSAPSHDVQEQLIVLLSDSYPRGQHSLLGPQCLKYSGTVKDVIQQICCNMCVRHKLDIPHDLVFDDESHELSHQQSSASTVSVDDVLYTADAKAYLERELHMVADKFGAHCTGSHFLPTGDAIVRVAMPITGLDKVHAEIYGLHLNKLLVIELEVAAPHLFQGSAQPKVKLFQASAFSGLSESREVDGVSFGLKWQCEQRIKRFLKQPDVWPNKLLHGTEQGHERTSTKPSLTPAGPAEPVAVAKVLPAGVSHSNVAMLTDMGFDELRSIVVLRHVHDNVETAAELLLGDEWRTIVRENEDHVLQMMNRPAMDAPVALNFASTEPSFLLNLMKVPFESFNLTVC
eukprot:TRINITY_DN1750_c0_g1_i2.p1 TRINITY_DN1750_c0_g1~~TRINITY_DN1750_c0_g1_i2.p1  ORF type:complete len:381 (+),score=70.94 TRINITY_DN1750_c0_g1_i2:56-1198(+)